MPAEQHKKAAEAFDKAAKMHKKAADKYKEGDHKEGANYAQTARGHKEEGKAASTEASKIHAKNYGSK